MNGKFTTTVDSGDLALGIIFGSLLFFIVLFLCQQFANFVSFVFGEYLLIRNKFIESAESIIEINEQLTSANETITQFSNSSKNIQKNIENIASAADTFSNTNKISKIVKRLLSPGVSEMISKMKSSFVDGLKGYVQQFYPDFEPIIEKCIKKHFESDNKVVINDQNDITEGKEKKE